MHMHSPYLRPFLLKQPVQAELQRLVYIGTARKGAGEEVEELVKAGQVNLELQLVDVL